MKITVVGETASVIPEDHPFFVDGGGPVNVDYDPAGAELVAEFIGRSRTHLIWRGHDGKQDTREFLHFLLSSSAWRIFEHSYVTLFAEEVPVSLGYLLRARREFAVDERPQRRTRFDRFDIPPAIPEEVGDDDELRTALHDLHEQSIQVWTMLQSARVSYADSGRDTDGDTYPEDRRAVARAALLNMTVTNLTLTGNFRSWARFLVDCDSPREEPDMQRFATSVGTIFADRYPAVFGPVRFAVWDVDKAEKWAWANRSGRAMKPP
ncbi:FAD-dependent thymidylate synthase [Rhodococcus sp. BP-241]|uniref:FAD-dependent thymidylate synthase n=1 Tax=Rhodococcus sp. BP-241 TaxID=2739441 RepID=UPI001C9B12F5|nr:FAD-dependent thymidylate synthase [Rhodococcus sp. BP-241]MBY6709066.1 FAD-dependent thymidylate synthase [Rhodococcus sp. BP-241]